MAFGSRSLSLALLATLLLGLSCAEKVLLADIPSFLAELGRLTAGRKSERVPQLKCDGGTAGCGYSIQPRIIDCVNLATTSTPSEEAKSDHLWKCRPSKMVNHRLQVVNVRVSCEGYNSQYDHHVLRDSCGVEYELNVTDSSEGVPSYSDSGYIVARYYSRNHGLRVWEWKHISAAILTIVLLIWIGYGLFTGRKPAEEQALSHTKTKRKAMKIH